MSADDCMRYNLVASALCAKCGSKLRFSTKTAERGAYQPEADDGITGAAKTTMYFVVHPCDKCYEKAAKPLALLKQALAEAAE